MESGETPPQALECEIREKLDAEIAVGDLIKTVEWGYDSFTKKIASNSVLRTL